MSIIDPPINFD